MCYTDLFYILQNIDKNVKKDIISIFVLFYKGIGGTHFLAGFTACCVNTLTVFDVGFAGIVKRIFALRIVEESIAGIVRTLNGEGIDTPAAYLRRKGLYEPFITKGEEPM